MRRHDKIRKTVRTLRRNYPSGFSKCKAYVDELVLTILSQNTADINSERAFFQLKKKFPNWDLVISSPQREIESAIKQSGFFRIKAKRIRRALIEIKRREGRISLSRLKKTPPSEAKAYLTSLYGVGHKTAAIIMLFCFGMPSLPVDTHVFRVSKRLGLVSRSTTPARAQEILESNLDPEDIMAFHVGLISHGRLVCAARNPKCKQCIFIKTCPSARKFLNK